MLNNLLVYINVRYLGLPSTIFSGAQKLTTELSLPHIKSCLINVD